MFGKMGDMMSMISKLKEAQKKMEEVKEKLDQETIVRASNDGNIEVVVSVAGNIKDISIKNSTTATDTLQIELTQTLNQALAEAREKYEKEIASSAMQGMPGMDEFIK